MRKNFGFFIQHLVRTFLNYFRRDNESLVVKHTAIFFNPKAQASVEYFVLLVIFAMLTLISVSNFLPALKEHLFNNLFVNAVNRILK